LLTCKIIRSNALGGEPPATAERYPALCNKPAEREQPGCRGLQDRIRQGWLAPLKSPRRTSRLMRRGGVVGFRQRTSNQFLAAGVPRPEVVIPKGICGTSASFYAQRTAWTFCPRPSGVGPPPLDPAGRRLRLAEGRNGDALIGLLDGIVAAAKITVQVFYFEHRSASHRCSVGNRDIIDR
jgi:hypothetical protein